MKSKAEYFTLSSTQSRKSRTLFFFYAVFFAFWAGSVVSLIGDVFASILG